jgi:hypothetical protein
MVIFRYLLLHLIVYTESSGDYKALLANEGITDGSVTIILYRVVTMQNGVFLDVTPCGSCKNRRFGGI